jgi:hypothetical protein
LFSLLGFKKGQKSKGSGIYFVNEILPNGRLRKYFIVPFYTFNQAFE